MTDRRIWWVIAILVVSNGSLKTSYAQDLVLKPRTPIREAVLAEIPISGFGVNVGLMAANDGRASSDTLHIWLGPGPSPRLDNACVSIVSIDGRYEVHAEFQLPRSRPISQRVALVLGVAHPEQIKMYTPNRLAVLVRLEEDCDRPKGPLAIAAWQASANPTQGFLIVNSTGTDVSVHSLARGAITQVPCELIQDPTARRFDRRCPLAVDARSGYSYSLHRTAGPRRLPDVGFEVVPPSRLR